jgi:UDP-N-acetylglucosamine--N-acetylmuramyl-(pentapeptide) pyrophosphoryl-undecaprenol N-acetylglucosamine transferase
VFLNIQKLEMQQRRVIISTGGTGGHIYPAIAVAEALMTMDSNIDILFVGAKGKMEMERVPKAGFKIIGLWISGFQRKFTLQNLLFPIKLIASMWKAKSIINDFKPNVVVGFGGYASGPILKVAANSSIPTVIQEQNSYAGVTNKLLAQKANKICVAYDGMDKYFPAAKLVLTGNPIRMSFMEKVDKITAYNYYQLDNSKKTVLIIGGSLGAKSLNQAMESNYELVSNQPTIQFLWQCGKLYQDAYQHTEIAALPNVKLVTFIDRMDYAYAIADVVISRAGALSISELCLVAKPVILIPSPNVAEDHQTKNANVLVQKNAALMIKDSEATSMIIEAIQLLKDQNKLNTLASNIKTLAKPNAANSIAEEILKVIK